MRAERALLCVVLLVAAGCEYNPSEDPFETFDRQAMLKGIAEQVASPGFDSLAVKAASLEAAAKEFVVAQDQASLAKAQQAWIALGLAWKSVEMFRQGPLDNNSTLLASIDTGAMDASFRSMPINGALVSSMIATAGTLDRGVVESLRPSLQGIPVLEYLLFSTDGGTTPLDKFTVGNDAPKYRSYLVALVESFSARAASLKNEWKVPGGATYTTYIGAIGRDIGSSLSMTVNDCAYLIEAMRNEKLGRALGYRTSGVPQPNSVEAFLSQQSIQFMLRNLEALRRTFLGGNDTSATGMDDLLDHMGATDGTTKLSERIRQQFAKTIQAVTTIAPPLSATVVSDRASVQAAYNEVGKLLVLMKVDMPNNLGVMITYQDNDGD